MIGEEEDGPGAVFFWGVCVLALGLGCYGGRAEEGGAREAIGEAGPRRSPSQCSDTPASDQEKQHGSSESLRQNRCKGPGTQALAGYGSDAALLDSPGRVRGRDAPEFSDVLCSAAALRRAMAAT